MTLRDESPAASSGSIRLRVVAASGHVARIAPGDLARLGSGEALLLRGARATALPVGPEPDALEGTVGLSDVARRNAGAELGDEVEATPVAPEPAEWITVRSELASLASGDRETLGNRLQGVVVVAGDQLRLDFGRRRAVTLVVGRTAPDGPVRVDATTEILAESGLRREPASYESVGGLERELARVREIVELPLRHPHLFQRLGITPPRGILLHGPPGCGKTLIARAVAAESEASFFAISGPEIIHRFYGESEAHLRTLFQEATAAAPSIVFIDEIDAIAPRRERVQGEVEKRVVAQLLALMDGLSRRRQVVVLAATNLPDALDPALRRPGRFDREIAIPVPDPRGRRAVLEVHTRAMPLDGAVDLDALAERTHGFVGADLEALCREAGLRRLRRHLEAGAVADESTLTVEVGDFVAALAEVGPSALREVLVELPPTDWSRVGGLASVERRLRQVFEWPDLHRSLFAAARLRGSRGVLLAGPPGCGKTLVARALAGSCSANFVAVRGPELVSMYVGESEERIRRLFRTARQASPCILFFDEIDTLFPMRQPSPLGSRVGERLLGQMLAELDGVEEVGAVRLLGATSHPERLDPALLRPGRFDEVLSIPLPDRPAREEILAIHLAGRPLAAGPSAGPAELGRLAEQTEGWSGAEIAEACHRSALVALVRAVEAEADSLEIGPSDLEEGFRQVERERHDRPSLPGSESSR